MRVLDKARTLRHQPTPAETQLWQCLRNRQLSGYKFRRQYPVGEYIADFACITAGLIIELDGNHCQHRLKTDPLSSKSPF